MYENIKVYEKNEMLFIQLDRATNRNSINRGMIDDLTDLLYKVRSNEKYKVIVIKGDSRYFCTGMDFQDINKEAVNSGDYIEKFIKILKSLSTIDKVVISIVEGKAMAGGVGFLAASDLVIASRTSSFLLSEAIWGLIPAMVAPYLIRKIGFAQCYKMTLTALPIDSMKALEINLVDEVSDNIEDTLRNLTKRIVNFKNDIIGEIKNFFKKQWIITDELEELSWTVSKRMLEKDEVLESIQRYDKYKIFPWEKDID